jgi:anti-repressor protein
MIDGVMHWVGKDICARLGYENNRDAYSEHCKGVAIRYPLQTPGGMQQMRLLAEADVFRLIVGSELPAAERFRVWLFDDV